jgi:hypothetical protein
MSANWANWANWRSKTARTAFLRLQGDRMWGRSLFSAVEEIEEKTVQH